MLKIRILNGGSTASNVPSVSATLWTYEIPANHSRTASQPAGIFISGLLIRLTDVTPNNVGCIEPVGILNGCKKNVRIPIATASATSSTSIFSRQAALGYGLSHLLAVFSRFSICGCKASLVLLECSVFWSSARAEATAPTAWGDKI